jgi:signal transduction histidine kinase
LIFAKQTRKWDSSRTNIVILDIVGAVAILLSILTYQNSTFISNKIVDIASDEVRSNSRIEVHDLSQLLANKLESISALLQTLADSPAIHNNEYKRAYTVINTRQKYSSQLTDFYMWLNKDGKLNWVSNINQTAYQKYKGTDLSYRPYFLIAKTTHSGYYSSLIESNDKVPRLYISYPVINTTGKEGGGGAAGAFTGVVVASIRASTLGNVLKSQLFPQFNSTIGLLDRNGIILYTTPQQYIGENVFEMKFQSALSSIMQPPESRIKLNDLIRESLQGKTGSGDILVNGKITTIAYQPVVVKGKHFLTLYISAQNSLASDVTALIDQQRYFTTLVVIIIGLVAFIVAFLVFSWNKRLEKTVNARTAELKKANDSLASAVEQLKVHDKMQKEFINVASHEMKTPTQAILGYSKLIQRHPEKQGEMLLAISRNASRLQRLTNDILDVTRIESQSLRLNKERFNLLETITSVINDHRSEMDKLDGDFKLVFERPNINDGPIFVEADKSRIIQIISNLLSNAIKFTKEAATKTTPGTVLVSTLVRPEHKNGGSGDDSKDEVIVSVKDTGNGIDPEIFPKLFTKFVTKSQSGTGLGLFISKSIIEAHGGRIWAENTTNTNGKKGAIFSFSLPLRNDMENDDKVDSNKHMNDRNNSGNGFS